MASTYLGALIKEIVDIYGALAPNVLLESALDDVELNLDRASVLGLIVTELLTNAYMHAFPTGTGRIDVSFKKDRRGHRALLTVSDNGICFDDNKQSKRTCVKLVKMLVQQIDGELAVSSASGARYLVTLPV